MNAGRKPALASEPLASGSSSLFARRRRPPRTDRRLVITVLVSLALHLGAATAALLLLHPVALVADAPEKPVEVELVMEEHKGDTGAPATPQPASQTPRTPEKPAAEAKVETPPAQAAATPVPVAPPPVEAEPDAEQETVAPAMASTPPTPDQPAQVAPVETAPPASAASAVSKPAPAEEPTPPAQPAPAVAIRLHGTDSPSDARAWGERILPAAPDAVFHNRPPEYPDEAARGGQRGTVVVLIHVSPSGRAAGVDVVRSSGYLLLDRAAREAVARWRFLPAVKDGQPVASDMTMGFVFDF